MTLGLKVGTNTSVSDTSSACKVFRISDLCQNKISHHFIWIMAQSCAHLSEYFNLSTHLGLMDTGTGSGVNHAVSLCVWVTTVTWLARTVSGQQLIITLDALHLGSRLLLSQLVSWAGGGHVMILYPATWKSSISVETGQTGFVGGVTIRQHWHCVAGLEWPDWRIWKWNKIHSFLVIFFPPKKDLECVAMIAELSLWSIYHWTGESVSC